MSLKSFNYTGRDRSGALKSGVVSAADRAAALQAVRDKGLTPIELTERQATAAPERKHLIMGLAAILVVGAAYLLIRAFPADRRPAANDAEAIPVPESPPVPDFARKTNEPDPVDARQPEADTPRIKPDTPALRDQPSRMTQAHPTAELDVDPERDVAVVESPPEPPQRRIPESTSEQMLLLIGRPGERRPPLPPLPESVLERDFEKFVATDLDIKPDDSPGVADDKEYLQWMRYYMEEHRAAGGQLGDFIGQLQDLRAEEDFEIRETLKLYHEIRKENPAEAERALAELNEHLAEKGLPPIKPRNFPGK